MAQHLFVFRKYPLNVQIFNALMFNYVLPVNKVILIGVDIAEGN